MLIIREIKTFTSDNAYEPWKKAILAVPLQSRSAIGSLAFDKRIALTNDPVVVRATAVSGCSPVRLIPVVGVTTGAHYRISTGHSSPAKISRFSGAP